MSSSITYESVFCGRDAICPGTPTKSSADAGESYIRRRQIVSSLIQIVLTWLRFAGAAGVITGIDCLFPVAERDAVGLFRKVFAGRRMECLRVDIADVRLLAASGGHLAGAVCNRWVQLLARCRLCGLPCERFAIGAAGDIAL